MACISNDNRQWLAVRSQDAEHRDGRVRRGREVFARSNRGQVNNATIASKIGLAFRCLQARAGCIDSKARPINALTSSISLSAYAFISGVTSRPDERATCSRGQIDGPE